MNRSTRARIAAHTRWAHEQDRTAATARARAAFQDRFEREVDPDRTLTAAERERRARSARSAHYTRLAARRHAKNKENPT